MHNGCLSLSRTNHVSFPFVCVGRGCLTDVVLWESPNVNLWIPLRAFSVGNHLTAFDQCINGPTLACDNGCWHGVHVQIALLFIHKMHTNERSYGSNKSSSLLAHSLFRVICHHTSRGTPGRQIEPDKSSSGSTTSKKRAFLFCCLLVIM